MNAVTLDPLQAEGTYQKLRRAGRAVEKFTFSSKSIHALSTTLYQAVQDETLCVFDDRELEAEVLALQVRETPDGWRFDHRAGGYSDRVVALCMALQAALKQRRPRRGLRVEWIVPETPRRGGPRYVRGRGWRPRGGEPGTLIWRPDS